MNMAAPDAVTLSALGDYASLFHSPWFSFGRWDARGFDLSPAASGFVRFCYDNGLVLGDFDWPEWMKCDEAQALRKPEAIRSGAMPIQLAQLLTVAIRQDRFVEGGLNGWFENGLLTAIADRAAALAAA